MKRGMRLGLYAVGGVLLGGSLVGGLVVRPKLKPVATVASGYMARVACGCHFIGKRSLESCLTDREAGMEQVSLSIDKTSKRVTASVPLLASASATYTPALGCVIDR